VFKFYNNYNTKLAFLSKKGKILKLACDGIIFNKSIVRSRMLLRKEYVIMYGNVMLNSMFLEVKLNELCRVLMRYTKFATKKGSVYNAIV
jgi:hypothetical protein